MKRLLILCLGALSAAPAICHADMTYNINTRLTMTVTDYTPVQGINLTAELPTAGIDSAVFSGDAFAQFSELATVNGDPLNMQLGDSIVLEANVSGFANLPFGFARSQNGLDGDFVLNNTSAVPITVGYNFTYEFELDSTQTESWEFASVLAQINYHTHGGILSTGNFNEVITSTGVGIASIDLLMTYPALQERGLHFLSRLDGSNTVPEPSALALCGLGLVACVGTAVARRRKRKAMSGVSDAPTA